ncbi:MAG: LysM peptidoglycan-binding domain-containing protein [Leptolyngbya sp.]|nr:LysM peptidoglycan-binding domain-containing protein [Candidatus Melainabacteria bacterium]
MSNEGVDSQRRLVSEGLARIEQGIVDNDNTLFTRASFAIVQMNQSQRDFVESALVRSGILPQMTVRILGDEQLTRRIDTDGNGQLSAREIDSHLVRESRNPVNRRNFVEEMVLNQVAQRSGIQPIQLNNLQAAERDIRMVTGYEQAMREYDGLSRLIGQRYPGQVSATNSRFEISAAERALEDDAKGSFLDPEQRRALNFMVANRDDLYKTRLGVGTLFGLATQYFDRSELERQAGRFGVSAESVESFDRVQRTATENLSAKWQTTTYQVQHGQSISDVAITNLRERNGRAPGEQEVNQHVERIARANNLSLPFRINSGQILRIPSQNSSDVIEVPPRSVVAPLVPPLVPPAVPLPSGRRPA